jgi:hypothetical protein
MTDAPATVSAPPPTGPALRRPPLAWFVVLDGGIVALTVLALSGRAHRRLSERLPLPGRRALISMLAATAVIHVGEAAYAGSTARRRGMPGRPWALQTLAVGFPSLLELRRTR